MRLSLLASLLTVSIATSADTGFLDRTFKDASGADAKYVLYVPTNYDAKKPTPIILFLHGSGETGTDGKKQAGNGLGNYVRKQKDFPAIIIFPQSQKRTWKADSEDGKRALGILEAVSKEYTVDPKRIYLTGLSMGGFGTWSMAAAMPDKWAAIVPVCGGGDPSAAKNFKDLPCWCFHGDADMAVKVEKSREMIAALKAAGGEPKYTEYPKVPHNSWDKAYATAELWDWLFAQKHK